MADHGNVEYATAPGNDYPAHEETYDTFIKFAFVGSIHIINLLLGLAVGGVMGHWMASIPVFLIAIIGLIVNTIMLFGIMAMFGFTFSLPGIAGMVLTIGMAVDANVLIYERLREEIAHGKTLKNAIEASYDRAFSAIFDSHVTSLLTAAILCYFGTSAIKGFAITLLIGVTASLFSAILVTRVIFRWGVDFGWLKQLTFLDLIKSKHYDFMGKRKIAFIFSGIMVLFGLIAVVQIARGAANLGIDFSGGTAVQLKFDQTIRIDEARKALEANGVIPENQLHAILSKSVSDKAERKLLIPSWRRVG